MVKQSRVKSSKTVLPPQSWKDKIKRGGMTRIQKLGLPMEVRIMGTGGRLSTIASGGDISAESLRMGSHPPGKERTV